MHHDSLTVAGTQGAIRTFHWPGNAPAAAPPLVFIHGMLGDATFWEPTVAALDAVDPRRPRAIAIELRGHGSSEPPANGDYSPDGIATDVAAMLDAYGLERAVVVGHSYGSLAALAFAALCPERVAQLVLVDPPGDFTRLPAEQRRDVDAFIEAVEGEGWREVTRAGFDEACNGGRDSTREIILSRLATAPRESTAALFRPMLRYPSASILAAYLARGDASAHAILAPSNALPVSLHTLCPTLAHTVIPNVGHWLILDEPAAFARALTAAA